MNAIIRPLKRLYYPIMGLLGLSFVIVAHEFGHFLAAKAFGVATPIFSIGFGPALVGVKIGQTLFQIAAIPFGGYVAMEPADLAAQPYVYKMIIILAGIVFNILFAYLVFFYLALRGKYTVLPIIAAIIPDSPAERAGLEVNDRIVGVNHAPIDSDMQKLLQTVTRSPGKQLTLSVEREGLTQDISIVLGKNHPILGPNIGWLGTQWQTVKTYQPGIGESIIEGARTINNMIRNVGAVTSTLFRKTGGPGTGIMGPIGIITMTGKSLALSPHYFALVLAMVSINVALFNLLPIPFLDGGKAAQYTIEAFLGPIPENLLNYISIIFLILFLLLLLSVTMGDIGRIRKKR